MPSLTAIPKLTAGIGLQQIKGEHCSYCGLTTHAHTNLIAQADVLYGAPLVILEEPKTIISISWYIAVGAAGSCRIGLYESKDGKPTTLMYDTDAASCVTARAYAGDPNIQVNPGLYYLAFCSDCTPTIWACQPGSNYDVLGSIYVSDSYTHVKRAYPYTDLPENFGAATKVVGDFPRLIIRL